MDDQCVSGRICTDVESLTDWLPGSSFTILPLGQARFRAEVVLCRLGDISVWIGRSTPFLAFGRIALGMVHLFLPLTGQDRMILHGRRVEQYDIAVGPSGGPVDGATHGEAEWAVVMMPSGTARRLLFPERPAWKLHAGLHYLLRADPSAALDLTSLLRSVHEVILEDPAVFDTPEPRRALRDSLLEALRALLGGSPGVAPARVLRISALRRSILERSEAYLAAYPDRAVSLAALSDGLGVPAARIRAAYAASFGMDAAAYLTRRRLVLVRSALRSSDGQARGLEDIARAHGFDRFADFARDYQRVFGEAVMPEDCGRTAVAARGSSA